MSRFKPSRRGSVHSHQTGARECYIRPTVAYGNSFYELRILGCGANHDASGGRADREPASSREVEAIATARIQPGLVHFALAVGGFAIGTTEFATMSLLRYFAQDLHIDEPTAGHVISSYALGVVVGAPVIAVLSARVTRRSLLMGLMGVFALSALGAVADVYFDAGVPLS
jgi:hypothetical protein